MPGSSTFGTVLVKRKANERPLDWELRLRPICQKIRVVEKLLGGAHAVVTGNPSIAVRIYNIDDATRMEAIDDDDDGLGGVDGLRSFRDSFEHSIVFFVLPSGQQQRDQLGRRESFLNTAQKSLLHRDKAVDENEIGKKRRTTRSVIVSDISQVIQSIDSLVQSLAPEKREKRTRYFAQVANKKYLPREGIQPTKEVIANHVTKTFNAWAERFEMENGDANVALNMMGSLANVVTANSMDEIPIRNVTKEMISGFFGANISTADDAPIEEEAINTMEENPNDDQFYDNIDDSELIECPDPSSINNSGQRTSHRTPFLTWDSKTTTNRSVVQNRQSFSDNIDFTPMISTRQLSVQQPQSNSASSIFPESFTQSNHFHQPPSTGRYRQRASHSQGNGSSSQMRGASASAAGSIRQQRLAPSPVSRGGTYQSFQHATDNVQGYQDTNHGYGGYSQSARFHTQQFT